MSGVRVQLYALDMGCYFKECICEISRKELAWINSSTAKRAVPLDTADHYGAQLPHRIFPDQFDGEIERYRRRAKNGFAGACKRQEQGECP